MGGKNDGRFSVIHLLDVNALIGLGFKEHVLHTRMDKWVRSLKGPTLATCAITELGFVRILAQHPEYDFTVDSARERLGLLKAASEDKLVFLGDHLGVDQLPSWVKQPKQTTDGHLVALAKAHHAVLATFDEKIPGAFVIPDR
jgi:predicted nucleic acid-binding protein